MSQPLRRVCLLGTGSALPNEPVPIGRVDDVLGRLEEAPPAVQRFLDTVGRRMLEQSGVETRHFAVDPETGRLTHTVAELAEEAARAALEAAGCGADDVDLLVLGSPNFDCMTPPTTTLLQERLEIESCAELEIHSNCTGVGKGVQAAFDALRPGRHRRALVVYAQLSSSFLRREFFNQAKVTREQALLRYLLADGAGAVLLEARDVPSDAALPYEILGTHVESVGARRRPGMTSGGGVADGKNVGLSYPKVYEAGTHHLDQDFAAIQNEACGVLLDGVTNFLRDLDLDSRAVDHYVWSMPTRQLYDRNIERLCETLGTPVARQLFRAGRSGYSGGASTLVHFDEMVRTGEIERGQVVVVYAVESSKWMSAGFAVRC